MLIRNTRPEFGTTETFEYQSREDAVNQMQPTILEWARQKYDQDDETDLSREEYETYWATEMSAAFEDGLEVVE